MCSIVRSELSLDADQQDNTVSSEKFGLEKDRCSTNITRSGASMKNWMSRKNCSSGKYTYVMTNFKNSPLYMAQEMVIENPNWILSYDYIRDVIQVTNWHQQKFYRCSEGPARGIASFH